MSTRRYGLSAERGLRARRVVLWTAFWVLLTVFAISSPQTAEAENAVSWKGGAGAVTRLVRVFSVYDRLPSRVGLEDGIDRESAGRLVLEFERLYFEVLRNVSDMQSYPVPADELDPER